MLLIVIYISKKNNKLKNNKCYFNLIPCEITEKIYEMLDLQSSTYFLGQIKEIIQYLNIIY